MSDLSKVWGYIYTDEQGNPRLPVVSLVNPATDPYVNGAYRLVYVGNDQRACVEAIQTAVVVDDGGARWAVSGGE